MNASRILRNNILPRAIANLIPKETVEALSNKPRNLYETLARLPRDGVGARVFQTRWQSKGIEGSFWEISRVKLEHEGTRGRAWGRLVWRGKPVSEREEVVRGGLKYMWAQGVSRGKNQPAVQDVSSRPVLEQMKKTAKERRAS
ncbi:uncharacterized protein FOMMEDRAFT_110293 [Fomitiporia mediterranea MF3/22]|uniref:uncharacterized protein n=1 Tax=Fomitiporia mediterranea (strain MF3/22) TaxID=694068 RepID=UPI000440942F|nr:uncharacterized protein FOMMEDRAFT_110293 [Fomitiporia mediterranea MF3/22]EJD00892.1 hypothetical protein FOMMEDRAFT_110293 [Fomitiporia mediterranea MF3/22]